MPTNSQPNIAFKRDEVKALEKQYCLIRDCIAGQETIKKARTKYLPQPNPTDVSPDNVARYLAYIDRANFYNVTKRTLSGLVGQVFLREPVIEVPKLLEIVRDDTNGGGIDLTQTAKKAMNYVIPYGRSGAFVDYPKVDGVATVADIQAGDIRPTIAIVAPWQIINWRTISRGGKQLLSLVVISETYVENDDGYEMKLKEQWRVLQLGEDGLYFVEVWRKTSAIFNRFDTYTPMDAKGARLTEIPFTFIGSENNDVDCDDPPMYDLAAINIGHYRNSADYEESVYMAGQPTPYFSGLTEQWVKEVMGGSVRLGSRAAVVLPQGGTAGLLQAEPNTMPFEAMQHKERQMVALGAKLVEQKTVQRTAYEAGIEETSDSSTLASAAQNVAKAIKWALEWCAIFVGIDEAGIDFSLNTEFDLTQMDPQERAELIKEWQSGAIAFEEMRENLRRAGVATLDDKTAKTMIDQELADAAKLEAANNPQPNDGGGGGNVNSGN